MIGGFAVKVLISGGGIAGPALAHWLHRHGIAATIVERAPRPRPGGHAVDVRGVARQVIERMGLMPAVLAKRVARKSDSSSASTTASASSFCTIVMMSLFIGFVLSGSQARKPLVAASIPDAL